jgi:transposase
VHLTPGNVHDVTQAPVLIKAIKKADKLLADKGYDAQSVIQLAIDYGMTPVISQRSNHLHPRNIDMHIYKSRYLVENCFQKLKRNRRVATRYEKTAKMFLAFVVLASIMIWIA